MTAADEPVSADVIKSAERLLRRVYGGRVRVAGQTALRVSDRSVVARCALAGLGGAPATVVLKLTRDFDAEAKGGSWNTPAGRFQNDWAGAALLGSIEAAPALAPRVIGGDAKRGFMLLEDIGDGESLAEALLGADADRAEAALFAFVRALGRMHASTIGREGEYQRLLDEIGPKRDGRAERQARVRQNIELFPDIFGPLELEWTPGLVDDVQLVAAAMLEPGPFLAYTHGDPCPDNDRLLAGGLTFFDFEFGAYRHALLDGAYPRVPFPTCWCVNRMPERLIERLEEAYRAVLVRTCSAAEDKALFRRGIVEASAYWLITTTSNLLDGVLKSDRTWGIASVRQRILYRLEVFARLSLDVGHLETFGRFAVRAREKLMAKWPSAEPMPLYPAFRGRRD